MWEWLKDFIGGIFGSKQGAELAVKMLAANAFRGKPEFAKRAHTLMTSCLLAIDASGVGVDIGDLVNSKLAAHRLLPEEKLLIGVLMGGVKEQLAKSPVPITPLKQLDQQKSILTWIKETALVYS